jgi:hypothetical protein
MMGAASTSETSVEFYHTARRNNPEDSHHTRRREKLKSHFLLLFTGSPESYDSSFNTGVMCVI